MTSLPDSARAVLESPALAHLVTLNPDGSPQVSVVWVGLDGDEIVAGHLPEHRKVLNILNDSRVALSLETDKRNDMGRWLPVKTRELRRALGGGGRRVRAGIPGAAGS